MRLYQAFREGGQFNDLQVGQVEVQLVNNRFSPPGSSANSTNNSTSGIRGYLDTLDNFKLQLGLPLTTNLELDDEPLLPIRQPAHQVRGRVRPGAGGRVGWSEGRSGPTRSPEFRPRLAGRPCSLHVRTREGDPVRHADRRAVGGTSSSRTS